MRWLIPFLLVPILRAVQALSSTGTRLLVVVEEATEQEKYSQLWGDLKGELLGGIDYPSEVTRLIIGLL
jgi:oligosaccharyltransferase complex subunit beta